jgi:hypothetical protein
MPFKPAPSEGSSFNAKIAAKSLKERTLHPREHSYESFDSLDNFEDSRENSGRIAHRTGRLWFGIHVSHMLPVTIERNGLTCLSRR